jgi:hypothetical protein
VLRFNPLREENKKPSIKLKVLLKGIENIMKGVLIIESTIAQT